MEDLQKHQEEFLLIYFVAQAFLSFPSALTEGSHGSVTGLDAGDTKVRKIQLLPSEKSPPRAGAHCCAFTTVMATNSRPEGNKCSLLGPS